jgi:hypothetical protein
VFSNEPHDHPGAGVPETGVGQLLSHRRFVPTLSSCAATAIAAISDAAHITGSHVSGAEWGLFERRGGAGVQLDDVGVGAGPTELLAQSAGEVDAALEPGSGFLGQRHRQRGIMT